MSIVETSPQNSTPKTRKRKSGIPTGNAGEYFVMGELLRRGYDAQLADRNTAGYDLLVGRHRDTALAKVQVKTVRSQPWYVRQSQFEGDMLSQITIYVLLGNEDAQQPVRYFIARNSAMAGQMSTPRNWDTAAFMSLKALIPFEGRWDILDNQDTVQLRRPRVGSVKERCFDIYLRQGEKAATRLAVAQGIKLASVRRWIHDWSADKAPASSKMRCRRLPTGGAESHSPA
ncbi:MULTISPECIES: hypothetical protein [Bradyrhizobium]|nr:MULTISPECIES: hypothetical protein [Bradyrhizobium]